MSPDQQLTIKQALSRAKKAANQVNLAMAEQTLLPCGLAAPASICPEGASPGLMP